MLLLHDGVIGCSFSVTPKHSAKERPPICNNLILSGFKLLGKSLWPAPEALCPPELPLPPEAVSQGRGVLTVLAVPPHEARPARALPADVVAVGSVLALADQGTVLPEKPQGTPCNTSRGRGREG